MIIRLTKDYKKSNGKVLKAGRVIETSSDHTYPHFEVLAKDGHLASPQNQELKVQLETEKAVKAAPKKAVKEDTKEQTK